MNIRGHGNGASFDFRKCDLQSFRLLPNRILILGIVSCVITSVGLECVVLTPEEKNRRRNKLLTERMKMFSETTKAGTKENAANGKVQFGEKVCNKFI